MDGRADPANILEDIQRVASELGKPPSTDDYREHGEFTVPTVYNHFDGFVAAREEAGVSEGELRPNSREELLADIQRVADVVGREPSYQDYEEHGNYAVKGIMYRFETWIRAKKQAGVYNGGLGSSKEISKDDILRDIQNTDEKLEEPISQVRYNEHGKFTDHAVKNRFESWSAACDQAGVDRPTWGPKGVTNEMVLKDIIRVAVELEHTPSKTEYGRFGEFTYGIIQTRFGTMSKAVKLSGLNPRPEGGQHGELHPLWEGGGDRYYGPNWESKKEKIRNRDGECKMCRMTEEEHLEQMGELLSVHHITRFEEFDHYSVANRDENLIALCRSCHSKIDEHDSQTREKLRRLV